MTETTERCAVCAGELIGDEVAQGTCGHCGGRSLDPRRRRQVGNGTSATEPSPETLAGIEAAYASAGFEKVEAVAVPVSFESSHTPWEIKVFGEGLGSAVLDLTQPLALGGRAVTMSGGGAGGGGILDPDQRRQLEAERRAQANLAEGGRW